MCISVFYLRLLQICYFIATENFCYSVLINCRIVIFCLFILVYWYDLIKIVILLIFCKKSHLGIICFVRTWWSTNCFYYTCALHWCCATQGLERGATVIWLLFTISNSDSEVYNSSEKVAICSYVLLSQPWTMLVSSFLSLHKLLVPWGMRLHHPIDCCFVVLS